MKKTKTVIIPAKPETTREIITYGCDICDYESKDRRMFLTCDICKRFICQAGPKSCHRYEYDFSDHKDFYCFVCHNLKFDVYKFERDEIEDKYESDINNLEDRILKDSLAVKGSEKNDR